VAHGIGRTGGWYGGALVLLNTPQTTFLHLVPWLLLVSALIFAATGPVTRWLDRRKAAAGEITHPPRLVSVFLFTIFVCFYIGYFGAGAGFLIITLLSLFGFQDLNEINALKVVATTMANGVAFLIFVIGRQVEWRYCLLAMITCAMRAKCHSQFCAAWWCLLAWGWPPGSSGETLRRCHISVLFRAGRWT
jgi:uncharacterized membrane protein YfcA